MPLGSDHPAYIRDAPPDTEHTTAVNFTTGDWEGIAVYYWPDHTCRGASKCCRWFCWRIER